MDGGCGWGVGAGGGGGAMSADIAWATILARTSAAVWETRPGASGGSGISANR